MRTALVLVTVLFSSLVAAAEAKHESIFGRALMKNSDVIVLGVVSATQNIAGTRYSRELTIEKVLDGKEKRESLILFFSDKDLFEKDKAVRGIFALKKTAPASADSVGRPVKVPEDDFEEDAKLRIVKEFIAMENLPAGVTRTKTYIDLLFSHLADGGWPAENAAIEFLFLVRDRRKLVTVDLYKRLIRARKSALGKLTQRARDDIKLVLQGMVERKIKSTYFKTVRDPVDTKAKPKEQKKQRQNRRDAATELQALQKEYPRAFTRSDMLLARAMAKVEKDDLVKDDLERIAAAIQRDLDLRKSD